MSNVEPSEFQSHSAGYLVNHAARLFSLVLADHIQPLGLAPAQFMVLLELWREDGVMQRDLCQHLGVEQPTMASTLNRMERDELIERRPNPSDSRAVLIYLTERARTLRGPAIGTAAQINAQCLVQLTPGEGKQFIEALHHVIAALQSMRGPRRHRRVVPNTEDAVIS